jgi:hypothetical protein
MNAINWKRAGLAAAVLFLTCGFRSFYPQALFNGRIATQIDRAMAIVTAWVSLTVENRTSPLDGVWADGPPE